MGRFQLEEIAPFDVRRGYKRWVSPGVGSQGIERGTLVQASIWQAPGGGLVARFDSRSERMHFRILSTTKIGPEEKSAIEEFLFREIIDWVVHDFER